MPHEAFKYFAKERTNGYLVPSLYAHFDFGKSGVSGSSVINSSEWINGNAFIDTQYAAASTWQYSGFIYLNSSTFLIKNIPNNNIAFLIGYFLDEHGNNVLISSRNNYESGYSCGINSFGHPYIEYYDNLIGPVTYCMQESVDLTGLLYFGISNSSVTLGVYNVDSQGLKKYNFSKNNISVYDSDTWCLGGDYNLNQNYFSGKISELLIYNGNAIDAETYAPNIISGFVCDLNTHISTGYISGQSGILSGDVIMVTGCSYFYASSGQFYSGTYQTGIEYYPTYEVFIDCNNKEYYKFTQRVISGYLSGYNWMQYLASNCFTTTGSNYYSYNSGYTINYSIKTILPFLKYPELITDYVNSIYLDQPIDENDTLSTYSLEYVNDRLNYNNILYDIFSKNYSIAGSINTNNFSGLYYNGQLQTISDNYTQKFENGTIVYLPNKDFFVSGSVIYGNKFYEIGNLSFDLWPTFDFVITGSINSGSQLPGFSFSNQMVFLNGQKLLSGIDYGANNKILFDIPSGYNVISITKNKPNFKEQNFLNHNGQVFNLGLFTKNNSSVWVNGIKLKLNSDYYEFIDNIYVNNNTYINKNGQLIYKN
jgi:hypothetical protein